MCAEGEGRAFHWGLLFAAKGAWNGLRGQKKKKTVFFLKKVDELSKEYSIFSTPQK